jgi:phosphoribosyl 1,2-cyclic phosphodiesterase
MRNYCKRPLFKHSSLMRICILSSGSSGNATLLVAGETAVLIDCGLSGQKTLKRLQEVGEDPDKTRWHRGHARARRSRERTGGAFQSVECAGLHRQRHARRLQSGRAERIVRRAEAISSSQDFQIGAFRFSPFAIPHDAADPLAFTVEANGIKLGMAVDLGYINQLAAERFRGSDVLIIEANHEIDMLRACTFYPWALKQRILGPDGAHLE